MAEAHENNSQKFTCRTSTLERVLSRFDSLTSFKKYMKALIRTIILNLRTSLHRLSESKDLNQFTNTFQEEHLNLLHEELSKKVIVSRFPATISSKYAKSMFNKLFARFSIQKKRNWRVFFLLGDIDCRSRVLRIGEVTIYDARQWYFGETEAFDLDYDPKGAVGENFKTLYFSYETWKGESRDIELRRNSARAYVEVKATDAYTAARNAEIRLNQVLDSLVFTFSSRNKVAGFKPQLPRAVEVTDLQSGNASYQFSSRKISKMLEIDRENDKIIEYYDKLASTSKIQFKDPIMRALSLFRSGYWDISTSSQFRNYWIALEQLIDSVPKTKPLAKAKIIDIITDRVPRLTITWQRAPDNYSINGMLGSVKMEIQNNHQLSVQLSRNPKLSKWKDDPVAIIENTQYLSRRIKNEHIKSNLLELEELFTGKKRRRLRNRVVALRDGEELRIGILYAMRNRLTHEGITYFEAEKIYIHNMETLLIDVLEAFLSHIDAENLDDLITRHNRPLDIRVRK